MHENRSQQILFDKNINTNIFWQIHAKKFNDKGKTTFWMIFYC